MRALRVAKRSGWERDGDRGLGVGGGGGDDDLKMARTVSMEDRPLNDSVRQLPFFLLLLVLVVWLTVPFLDS